MNSLFDKITFYYQFSFCTHLYNIILYGSKKQITNELSEIFLMKVIRLFSQFYKEKTILFEIP